MVRIYLSLLLLAMATGQLLDVRGFVEIMETYQLGDGESVAWCLAAGLVAGQLSAAAVMLGPKRWRKHGAMLAVVVAVAWTMLAVQAFARGLQIDNCGCFGVYLGQELRWYVLVQDAAFIGVAAWAWVSTAGWRLRGRGNPGEAAADVAASGQYRHV